MSAAKRKSKSDKPADPDRQAARAAGQQPKASSDLSPAGENLPRDIEARITELVQANEKLRQEIAERRQAEEALARERDLLFTLLDNLPDYIYVKDTQSRFLLANEAIRRHLGAATIGDIIGKTDFDFSPRDLAEQYYAEEQALFQSGQPLLLHKEPIFDHEIGDKKWVLTIKVPFRNSQGKIAGLVGMSRDITELKKTEEALYRAHNELETRVLKRTDELARANEILEAQITERKAVERREKLAYELGRQLTTLLDTDALLTETVNRLKDTFGYYHVHVYLIDDSHPGQDIKERLLIVREGSGKAGALLKSQMHSIPLNAKRSLVAQAARRLEPVIVNDVSQNPDHLPNVLLPNTRSEVAVPLCLGERLIGVLDVQHYTIDHFNVHQVRTLQIVAGQLSVALANAQLFAENARRLAINENSSDLVALIKLEEWLVLDINPAGVRLTGCREPDEILYKPMSMFHTPEHFNRIKAKGIPIALEQGVWRGESFLRRVDGTLVPVFQTIFFIRDDRAQPELLVTMMTDITKRKQAEEERERLFEEVKAGRERLQTLSHRLVEVQEAERRHIARELHDEVGQLLTGLKLTLEMNARLPNSKHQTGCSEAQALVNELIKKVRELSLELRPAMLDDLGLLPTLLWHFERYTAQTQIQVNFQHLGLERRFGSKLETTAYRIVQEALTNVARYAGVSEVRVRIGVDQDSLNVHIDDRGAGFDLEANHAAGSSSGLSGMCERATLLGGQLSLESTPGRGTRLTVQLPLVSS